MVVLLLFDVDYEFFLVLLDNEPSFHWLKNFLTRHKTQIKMVKEKKMESSRRTGFTEEVRSGWFKKLHDILIQHDLEYKPVQIWNMDESGFADETQCK